MVVETLDLLSRECCVVSSQIYHRRSSPFHPEKLVEVGGVGREWRLRFLLGKGL